MSSADSAWSRAFDDPISVPDGRVLKTLHDAGHYAAALPRAEQEQAAWQTAAEMLILAAKGERPVMFADIAMRQALHAGKAVPASKSRCKPARKVARRNPFLFFGPFAP